MLHLFLCYCLANIIGLIFYEKSFDLLVFLDHLIYFDLQGPYYYFAFFFQLIMIAPFLVKLCAKCSKQKAHWLFHGAIVLVMILCCKWLVHDTNILDIYGGGGKLFGGSYLLIYYIGMIFYQEKILERLFKKHHVACFLICSVIWLMWNYINWYTQYAVDDFLFPLFGVGINPPGVIEMVSAILVMCICYNFETVINRLIDFAKNKYLHNCLGCLWRGVLFVGRNTLYIFLYHLMAQTFLLSIMNIAGISNIWILRIVIYMGMLVLPAIIGSSISKAIKAIQKDTNAKPNTA